MMDLFEDDIPITKVVSIRKKKDGTRDACDVRIDRSSDWGNPYSHLPNTKAQFMVESREEAIEKYREYIQTRPDLIARLHELKGKTLGCWCVPKRCHGDILVELVYQHCY